MNKYMKSLPFFALALFGFGQGALAVNTPPNSPTQSKRSSNEVRVLMDEALTHKASTKKGANARNQLAFLFFSGQVAEGVITYNTLVEQLKQVSAIHDAKSDIGARARCLLSIARMRGLVGENVVTFADTVTRLRDVIATWESNTIPGAVARINLVTMRANLQIEEDVLTANDAIQMTLETIDAATHAGLNVDFEAARENYRVLLAEIESPEADDAEAHEHSGEPELPKVEAEPETKRARVTEESDVEVLPPLFDLRHETFIPELEFTPGDASLDDLEFPDPIGDIPKEFL